MKNSTRRNERTIKKSTKHLKRPASAVTEKKNIRITNTYEIKKKKKVFLLYDIDDINNLKKKQLVLHK